jgi:hypothetical protein
MFCLLLPRAYVEKTPEKDRCAVYVLKNKIGLVHRRHPFLHEFQNRDGGTSNVKLQLPPVQKNE